MIPVYNAGNYLKETLESVLSQALPEGEMQIEVVDDCSTEIDVQECSDHCEDAADAHSNIEEAADACEECLDNRSCDEVASCIPACKLVPGRN